jgi:transposase InsO family protein
MPEEPLHTKSYSAKYKDYLWHTDLHEVKSQPDPHGGRTITYMIAFMDDATRFIVGWELIADKTAATCAAVLARILNATGLRPCVLGSDNGGEFKGDIFVNLLEQRGIRPWYTEPYTPQQNGKIERFWQTMEDSTEDTSNPQHVANFIQLYHDSPHAGLDMTPEEAREFNPSWTTIPSDLISPEIFNNLYWF